MRLLPCGDTGLLVELDGLEEVHALYAALSGSPEPPAGVTDLVPAARTVLVRVDPARTTLAEVARWVRRTPPVPGRRTGAEVVEVPVRYDGEDLTEVARLTGLGHREVVAAHTGHEWTVAFAGFSPGFGYLVGGDPRLVVPRRRDPRVRVPAGAVALAGEYAGIYPSPSPGGWQLIGRTDLVLWDPDRDPPALLRPGARVRFVEAR